MNQYKIDEIKFSTLLSFPPDKEGILFLGAGGDLNEWVEGISERLHADGVTTSPKPEDNFSEFYVLKTSGGRNDLLMVFAPEHKFDVGSLAVWRLRFGDNSWLSDYKVNHSEQHLN